MAGISEPDPSGPDPRHPIRVRAPWQVMAYVREARINRQWSQWRLAQAIGSRQPTLVGWENAGLPDPATDNTHLPRLENVLALLDVLGYDMVIRPRGYMDIVDGPPIREVHVDLDAAPPDLPTPVVDVCMFCGGEDCARLCAGWKAAIERGEFGG